MKLSCDPVAKEPAPWVEMVRRHEGVLRGAAGVQVVLGAVSMVLGTAVLCVARGDLNGPQVVGAGVWGGAVLVAIGALGLVVVERATHYITPSPKAVRIMFIIQYISNWVCCGVAAQVVSYNIQVARGCSGAEVQAWCVQSLWELSVAGAVIGGLMILSLGPVIAIYIRGQVLMKKMKVAAGGTATVNSANGV